MLQATTDAESSSNKVGTVDKESPYEDQLPQLHKQDQHLHVNTIPWRYKAPAGLMILLFAFGSSLSETTLGPLKSTLIKELKITNAQYGTISSASSLVSTVLPIVGGIYMDHWGATYAAIISSAFILVGAIISSSGANTGQVGMVIGGRILLGFGSTVIESTQSKLYAHWFAGSNLAFIYGIDIAWSRITTIIARSAAVPMSELHGWWGWALWIPAIVCAANLGLCIGYWAFERSLPQEHRPPLGKDARNVEGWSKRYFGLKSLFQLPMLFWIVCGTQVPQNAAVGVLSSNLADIQTQTRGTSKLAAGYNSSLQGVIPIVLTPAVGAFFDRIGWRMPFVSFTGALYIIVFALIGLTTVHPLAPILLSSFALSTNAITFIASIPILVGNDALLGTAFGVWKSFANCNSIILEVAAGAIQDRSGGSYNNVIYLLIAIKAVQVCLGPVYDILDGRWLGHALRKPERKRLELRLADKSVETIDHLPATTSRTGVPDDMDRGLKGWRPSKLVCGVVLTELACAIVVAWVVYIVYSIGT